MPTKVELKKLAETRLREARVLFANGLYEGAYYLAGYVIELALKARICKLLDRQDYPENENFAKAYKTHSLDDLLKLAGLKEKFDRDKRVNQQLFNNWSLVTRWKETFRYNPVGNKSRQDIEDLINAIEDSRFGIFTWIRKRW